MLLLTSTGDLLRVTTSAAASIDVQASYVDYASGVITPGRTNTAPITTAATTTVVASPGASTQRNVKHVSIRNKHASIACDVTLIHTDGSQALELIKCTLAPGECLTFNDGVGFKVHNSAGALKQVSSPANSIGTATNDDAAAGVVGEVVASTIAQGAAVSLTTGVVVNVASISLTAGDWDVWFEAQFENGATTTLTLLQSGITVTSATMEFTAGNVSRLNYATGTVFGQGASTSSVNTGPSRRSLSATTTIYGVVVGIFGTSTLSAWGILRARRVR